MRGDRIYFKNFIARRPADMGMMENYAFIYALVFYLIPFAFVSFAQTFRSVNTFKNGKLQQMHGSFFICITL